MASIIPDGNITDPDGNPVEAIAVILADQTNGVWQYSIGGGWQDLGIPSLTAARLLGPTDKLRFVLSLTTTDRPPSDSRPGIRPAARWAMKRT